MHDQQVQTHHQGHFVLKEALSELNSPHWIKPITSAADFNSCAQDGSKKLTDAFCLVKVKTHSLSQLQSDALWEIYWQRGLNTTYTNTSGPVWRWSCAHRAGILRDPSHTGSPWSGASRFPPPEPHPLSSHLHFTLSVLSLCLITRRSMFTVNLLGGERDWEIKFILNSSTLMW